MVPAADSVITSVRLVEALDRDGYAVLTDVFSAEEIARMRRAAEASLAAGSWYLNGGQGCGPLLPSSDLGRWLLHDERLVFPVDEKHPCRIYIHADTFNDWHADAAPGLHADLSHASAWMYKMVIYLQDHPERDGFSVVPGSHRKSKALRSPLHVTTRAGDVVVFDHRVIHAGRLPNRMLAEVGWRLFRLRLITEMGRQRLIWLQHLIQPKCTAKRLALFVIFSTLQDIERRSLGLAQR